MRAPDGRRVTFFPDHSLSAPFGSGVTPVRPNARLIMTAVRSPSNNFPPIGRRSPVDPFAGFGPTVGHRRPDSLFRNVVTVMDDRSRMSHRSHVSHSRRPFRDTRVRLGWRVMGHVMGPVLGVRVMGRVVSGVTFLTV